MNGNIATHAWHVGLGWTLTNAAGWLIGFGLMDYVMRGLGWFTDTTPLVAQGAIYTIGATILALWQWLPLRSRVDHPTTWVAATMLGFIAGWSGYRLIEFGLYRLVGEESIIGFILLFALIGFTVGLAQWLVLRKVLVQAGWWIMANVIGWALGTLAIVVQQFGLITFYTTFGLVSGVITGLCLVQLWRSSSSPLPEPGQA
jgi:hypothetical protein